MRKYKTGATRDDNSGKFDYSGFISPFFLEGFATYMHKHRVQADGSLRDSDNWKKGIPISDYKESLIRHVVDWWKAYDTGDWETCDELTYAIMFNLQGFGHERYKVRNQGKVGGRGGKGRRSKRSVR